MRPPASRASSRRRRSPRFTPRSIALAATAPLWLLLAWTTTTIYQHRRNPTMWLIVVIVVELVALLALRLVERVI